MWLLYDTDLGLIIAVFSGIAIVIGFTLINDAMNGYSRYDRSSNLLAGLTALAIGFVGLLCGLSLHNLIVLSLRHPGMDNVRNTGGYSPFAGIGEYILPLVALIAAISGFVLRDQASHVHGYNDSEMHRMRNTGLIVGAAGAIALLGWGVLLVT